jgi:hypothetical protein
MQSSELVVRGIEGENDFSGKRYVWLRDPAAAFVRGWVVEELDGDNLLVQCEDGSVCERLVLQENLILTLTSNAKFIKMRSIRSIQPNSTKPMTWLNSRT